MRVYQCIQCSNPLFLQTQVAQHGEIKQVFSSNQQCQVFITKPSNWMTLEGESGQILCPKCHTKLGQYVWHGNTCSCGQLVVPYIAFVPSRLLTAEFDE